MVVAFTARPGRRRSVSPGVTPEQVGENLFESPLRIACLLFHVSSEHVFTCAVRFRFLASSQVSDNPIGVMDNTQLRNQGLAASVCQPFFNIEASSQEMSFEVFFMGLVDRKTVLQDGNEYYVLKDASYFDAEAFEKLLDFVEPFENFRMLHGFASRLAPEAVVFWWGDFYNYEVKNDTLSKAQHADAAMAEWYLVQEFREALATASVARRRLRKRAYRKRRNASMVSSPKMREQNFVLFPAHLLEVKASSPLCRSSKVVDPGLRVLRRYKARVAYEAVRLSKCVKGIFDRVRARQNKEAHLSAIQDLIERFNNIKMERIRTQAGASDAKVRRAARDAAQRAAAAKAKEAKRKKVPKLERAENIRLARAEAAAAKAAQNQSGEYQKAAFVAAGAVGGAGLFLLYNKIVSLTSNVDKSASAFGDFFSMLVDGAKSLRKSLGDVLSRLPVIMIVWYVLNNITSMPDLLLQMILSALSVFCGKIVWEHISKFFLGGNVAASVVNSLGPVVDMARVVNQASDDKRKGGFWGAMPNLDTIWSTLPGLFVTTFCCCAFKDGFDDWTFKMFMNRVSFSSKSEDGVSFVINWIVGALEKCVNFALEQFGMEKVKLLDASKEPLFAWLKSVDTFCAKDAIGGTVDPETLDMLDGMVREGYNFKQVYAGQHRTMRTISDYLARLSAAIVPYQGAYNARNNFRLEPSMLCLAGKPGVGKTLLSMHICAAVMLGAGLLPPGSPPDKIKGNVFQKGVSPYWNGYARQLCFVNDDAFQKIVTPQDEENDYMNIVRMIGSFAFPLNFADVASKGKIYFASEFVYASTNATCLYSEASKCMNDVPAIIRRINHPYFLTVAPEYALPDGKLDYDKYIVEHNKCANNTGLERFPWYVWQAARQDFLNGPTDREKIPLIQVIRSICAELRARKAIHSTQTAQLDDFITGFAEPVTGKPEGLEMQPLSTNASCDLEAPLIPKGTIVPQGGLWQSYKDWAKGIQEWSYWVFNEPYSDPFSEDLREAQAKACFLAETLSTAVICFSTYAAVYLLLHGIRALFLLVDYFVSGVKARPASAPEWKDSDVLVPDGTPAEQSNRPVGLRVQHLPTQSPVFQAGDKAPVNNVYSNAYKMFLESNDGLQVVGQVNFVNDRLAMQPLHYTTLIKRWLETGKVDPTTMLTFRSSANHECVFHFTVKHYLGMPRFNAGNGDCEFLRFAVARAHRNVIGNYMREADLKSLPGWKFRLDVVEIDDRKIIKAENSRKAYYLKRIAMQEDLCIEGVTTPRYFVYDAATDNGDCGATLSIVDNTNFSGRTCAGFHIAGSPADEFGFSVVVTQEMILQAQKELKIITDLFDKDLKERNIKAQASDDHFLSRPGSTLPLCVLEKGVPLCPKTSYYKTSLYGEFGAYDCAPAELSPVLRNGEYVYPMVNALEAYTSPVLHYEQPWLKQALHVAMKPFVEETGWKPRLLSFEEAVLGVPQEKIRSIPRGTAAGFPYLFDVRDGKKEFFGDAQEYTLDSDLCILLKIRVRHIIDCARRGERLAHVFVDFLKDELRPQEKVDSVATRLISCSPLDYTIAWRMYFASFSSMVMRLHVKTSMAPGICAYTDWDQLARKLKLKGTKVFDGDFKRFDASEQPVIHALMLEFINGFYDDGEENALIREVLWADMVHSRHVGGLGFSQKTIYQWNKSLPSGHPFTTIINSMYSLFMIVAAYISTTGDLTGFWDHVSAVVYGDDNAVNVDDSVVERFNQVTVSDALAREFSLVYTAGSKTGVLEPFTSLENITFLKRGIVRHEDGFYMSPLELKSFMYTPYWCKNKKLEKKILIDVLEMALFELSQHPQSVWDEFAPQIARVFGKRGHVSLATLDRNEYLSILRTRSDAWY